MPLDMDIRSAQARFEQYAKPILGAFASAAIPTGEQITPPMLVDALRQLFALLGTDVSTWDPSLPPDEPERVGDIAIGLLMDLATWAERLRERQAKVAMELVAVSIAAWVIAQHGQILTLEPIVNGLAALANTRSEAAALYPLAVLMGQVADAAAAQFAADLDSIDPRRPWRILLINWGITATRAHSPQEMTRAFQAIRRHLPADARAFFAEGRQQVEQGDFPDAVRAVMIQAADAIEHSLH